MAPCHRQLSTPELCPRRPSASAPFMVPALLRSSLLLTSWRLWTVIINMLVHNPLLTPLVTGWQTPYTPQWTKDTCPSIGDRSLLSTAPSRGCEAALARGPSCLPGSRPQALHPLLHHELSTTRPQARSLTPFPAVSTLTTLAMSSVPWFGLTFMGRWSPKRPL